MARSTIFAIGDSRFHEYGWFPQRTSDRTRSGACSPSAKPSLAPQDEPRTCARSIPSVSRTATASPQKRRCGRGRSPRGRGCLGVRGRGGSGIRAGIGVGVDGRYPPPAPGHPPSPTASGSGYWTGVPRQRAWLRSRDAGLQQSGLAALGPVLEGSVLAFQTAHEPTEISRAHGLDLSDRAGSLVAIVLLVEERTSRGHLGRGRGRRDDSTGQRPRMTRS